MTDAVIRSGTVAAVSAHRFTPTTEGHTILADLGPEGAERVVLVPGDAVTITGEQKPSGIKVASVSRGGETVAIPHGPKSHERPRREPHHDAPARPTAA